MTKHEQIKELEAQITELQERLDKVKQITEPIKRGDFIVCTASVEWSYSKGDRMWVDSIADGHIHCRSANPEYRANGIYWVSNSDWAKE